MNICIRVITSLCLLLSLTSCGVQRYYIKLDGTQNPDFSVSKKKIVEKTIEVDLIAKPILYMKNSNGDSVWDEISGSFDPLDIEAMNKLKTNHGANTLISIENYGQTLAEILKDELEKKTDNKVVVNLKAVSEEGKLNVTPSLTVTHVWGSHLASIKLEATSNSGQIISTMGEGIDKPSKGHIVWMVPVLIVTFPVGIFVTLIVGPKLQKARDIGNIKAAMRAAAADLATKLQKQIAVSNGTSNKWTISMVSSTN